MGFTLVYGPRVGHFDRYLTVFTRQPGFEGVRGILIGCFQQESKIDPPILRAIIGSKSELEGMPIVADADFRHTAPMFTFPIGGAGRLAG